ncbi:MAG: NAD(P)-dependent oxidoreductase [Parachlamydiaceae bacterium]|nr:NAD(P)-dependent oxidoreductase [Parachlamydiaceae bacterium]
MKILFTGASSFSGMWFIKALIMAGHEVTPIYSSTYKAYEGIRKQRVDQILKICQPIFEAPFGHKTFLGVITSFSNWDIFCHHAAEVANYKNSDFNPIAALAKNTYNLQEVLQVLKASGCHHVALTGSVFEQNEGAGSENLKAVSPYGLSKSLTSDTFAFYTSTLQMNLGKFIIPNPFGSFEEARFTSYLAKNWLSHQIPSINTPQYVRDNIPISLLAATYVKFVTHFSRLKALELIKYNPSFFAESQAEFTQRFSQAMQTRFAIQCPYELKLQTDFNEPLVRINTDRIDANEFLWNETQFWDELADYYIKIFG